VSWDGTARHSYQLAVCDRILKRGNQDRKERAMARITRAVPHVSVEEVKERMNTDPNPLYRKRWLIIYNALVDPREAKDIAKHTGVSVKTVQKLISTYNRLGMAAVETPGKGGRRNEYGGTKSQVHRHFSCCEWYNPDS
jgi:DNA-binding NarL/FixJ family response regulator